MHREKASERSTMSHDESHIMNNWYSSRHRRRSFAKSSGEDSCKGINDCMKRICGFDVLQFGSFPTTTYPPALNAYRNRPLLRTCIYFLVIGQFFFLAKYTIGISWSKFSQKRNEPILGAIKNLIMTCTYRRRGLHHPGHWVF